MEPIEGDPAVEQMHVLVHVDERGRNYLVRLLADLSALPAGAPPRATRFVDMALILPFQVEAAANVEVLRLLNAVNLGGLIGAFALSELDRVVLVRHTWHAPLEDIKASSAFALLQLLALSARETGPMIEQVATGAIRFDEIVSAVRTQLESGQNTGAVV